MRCHHKTKYELILNILMYFFQVLSFCVSTYAVRCIRTAVSTNTTNIIKECDLTKKPVKNTNIYNEKQNNAKKAEVLFKCNVLRPIVRNEFRYVHELVNELSVYGHYVKRTQNV
jgi:hypothetical protein